MITCKYIQGEWSIIISLIIKAEYVFIEQSMHSYSSIESTFDEWYRILINYSHNTQVVLNQNVHVWDTLAQVAHKYVN